MNAENFIKTYLQKDECGIEYITNNTPCDFFVDNQCLLGDCKPKSCANFPHTNQPGLSNKCWGIEKYLQKKRAYLLQILYNGIEN